MSPALDLVALSLLPLHRWPHFLEQFRAGQTATAVLCAECAQSASGDVARRAPELLRERARAALDYARKAGLTPLLWSEPQYPASLMTIVDPPPVLWARGAPAVLDAPAVAIIGSRAGSPYALAAAERLSSDLAVQGVVIVSGMARGVDAAAHRGALAAHGRTIAVLGCGADVVYPKEHQRLAIDIADSGAVVSELTPGTPPRARFFPRRNRLISGLARAVVVIEAGEKSGSLITARCALEQGRDVLAVPGNILTGRNRGGHALIRDGARIVETADDILDELGLTAVVPDGRSQQSQDGGPPGAKPRSPAERVVACLSPGETCDLDAISERTGLPATRLLSCLFELELGGRVRRAGGGRFVRV